MNKSEITIVALLSFVLVSWMYTHRTPVSSPEPGNKDSIIVASSKEKVLQGNKVTNSINADTTVLTEDIGNRKDIKGVSDVVEEDNAENHILPEKTVTLSCKKLDITVSSWGGAITSVELKDYKKTIEKDSGHVRMDFSKKPAFSLLGLPGLSINNDFNISLGEDGNSVNIEAVVDSGLSFKRIISVVDGYRLEVVDTFSNKSGMIIKLPEYRLGVGPMEMIATKARTRGLSYLGLDTLAEHGGEGVMHWAKGAFLKKSPLVSFFVEEKKKTGKMPSSISKRVGNQVSWVAAKNKFFIQIMSSEGEDGFSDCELNAERKIIANNSKRPTILTVSASPVFSEKNIYPGESVVRKVKYYVGAKKYSILKDLGNHQDEVMLRAWKGWGWFRWVCVGLLWTFNALYSIIPNYGVAIIILTIIVKIFFWPFTHKSTESMKKMQKIQPLVAKMKEKHKNNPKKIQQEQLALYKEHGVNPMASCLPMLFQMPVFLAMFIVIRSSVELRFADFLWIKDLTEPEGLFAGTAFFKMLPLISSLNILPLFMTATTFIQQKLTPSSGDSQQQKMMMFMPVFMLFIFYNMASALVLYWSVSQSLSIIQLLYQRRNTEEKE